MAEVHPERIDPEVVESLGITGGDVAGHPLVEPELGEQPEAGRQTLLAVEALLFGRVEHHVRGKRHDLGHCLLLGPTHRMRATDSCLTAYYAVAPTWSAASDGLPTPARWVAGRPARGTPSCLDTVRSRPGPGFPEIPPKVDRSACRYPNAGSVERGIRIPPNAVHAPDPALFLLGDLHGGLPDQPGGSSPGGQATDT